MAERKFDAHPESAPGDFYIVNHECFCIGCTHTVAPDLIGWASDAGPDSDHCQCIWKKQPETSKELEQAIKAFEFNCQGSYRYAGTDPLIMEKIGLDRCDHAQEYSRPSQMGKMFWPYGSDEEES